MIVSKFGGTSMGSAEAINRSVEISLRHKAFITVVSATSGTTNQLIDLCVAAKNNDDKTATQLLTNISERHITIEKELELSSNLISPILTELQETIFGMLARKEYSLMHMDYVLAYGERLSSALFFGALSKKALNAKLLDARKIIITDRDFGKARPLISEIKKRADQLLVPHLGKNIFVTQGFIGSTLDGETTTLGRGGSDYSAALFAEAVDATELEIWTDVPGIATTDPRICADAKPLLEISFKEASELAVFGAKVLHPATLAPAIRKNIPVFVGSSFAPDETGTWIRKESTSAPLLRALALRKNQALMTLTTPDMLNSHGFLFKIFEIFNDHKISVDAITTSEISVALTIDGQRHVDTALIRDLSQFADVQVEENLSLVALIGNNINHTPGLAQKVFSIIPEVNIRMICQGASKHNFCFLVSDEHGPDTIRRLHKHFDLADR